MKNIFSPTLMTFLIVFLCTPAFAGKIYSGDLTGTWEQADSWGARAGKSEHKLRHGDTWTTMKEAPFILKITEQSDDGRAIHGEWCSPEKCEDVVGAVTSDGTIYMADEDGHFVGHLIGQDLELCYIEADENTRIVNCRVMVRK